MNFFFSSVHKCEIGVQCCENHSFKDPYVFLFKPYDV